MTEGANLRSAVQNQVAPLSKGMESPVVGSLRHKQQILDDNNDAAWERELKKKKKGKKDAKVRRSSKWG